MSEKEERMLRVIQQMIEENGLKSEEEFTSFIQNEITGKLLGDLENLEENLDMSDEEMALDFVHRAEDENDDYTAVSLIKIALTADNNCVDAYLFLARIQSHPFLAEHFLRIAVKISKKKFSLHFLRENREHLWTIHRVRPYLKALYNLAEIYFYQGLYKKNIKMLEKLINLCPNNNTGAKELLMTSLLCTKKFKKYDQYYEMFGNDHSVSSLYNAVFYSFFIDDDLEKTYYLLKEAQKQNPHVVKKLIHPKIKLRLTNKLNLSKIEQANNYCFLTRNMWQQEPKLIQWLKQHH